MHVVFQDAHWALYFEETLPAHFNFESMKACSLLKVRAILDAAPSQAAACFSLPDACCANIQFDMFSSGM